MTKDEAIQIANEYMKKKGGFPYQFIYAHKRTKDDRTFWHVSYQFIFPEGRAMEPGSTILKIDMETKEVSAIPLM